ncbi:ParB/RepB/Spo0J family partition protein [Streptomyces sp. NK08204]|uniref:ParB/RepB/Spo0J family partition protein n=1 Tax=Streptomyces sp. NK08204 TaxID=2873260 RepID=UPI001CECA672|nr:ParB/RepB/Spo0J family partition protein [Streptomyces sp. NK08204]
MTKKADQLGAGRFGASARPVSARRAAVAAATGVPTDGIAPPTELSPHRISPNPDNPRSSLGDLTGLAGSLATHGQKQAITVMNRDAYLKANPGREADLEPDTYYVVIDGSSRLAAAREAGLATVKIMVSDDQGSTSEELLESALVANIHRQDLDELDEARALQRLLAIHGSQTALAKRLHRSQGWVSQRLALLNLTPELQSRIGTEPIDLLRAVGNKPAEQQANVLEDLKAERARKDAQKQARQPEPKQDPELKQDPEPHRASEAEQQSASEAEHHDESEPHYDVIEETPPQPLSPRQAPPPPQEAPAAHEAPVPRESPVPEPRCVESPSTGNPPKLPYDDGAFLAMHLIRKMTATEFDKMLRILNEHQQQRLIPVSAPPGADN